MNIGIIGLGHLGGGLAKSLRKVNYIKNIIALDKDEESLKLAKKEKVITDYTLEINDKFKDCDIIFICVPVSYIMNYAKKLDNIVKDDCIFTDIGSTKSTILEQSKNLKHEFIGGHPMVGSERSGYLTSIDYLFENSYYIITKKEDNKEESINKLKELIKEIKAIPIIVDSYKHDYVTAAISHVPQIIAVVLVNMVQELDDNDELMKTLAAGGFRDMTRIASSEPKMWEDICKDNSKNIKEVLKEFKKQLNNYEDNIELDQATYNYFLKSKIYRDSFINKKVNGNTYPGIDVSIKDEVGSISEVLNILTKHNIGIKNIEVINNREDNNGSVKISFKNIQDRDNAYTVLKNKYIITRK